MTLRQQLLFWFATFVTFVFLLWLLSEILLPFVVGLALAYLLAPTVERLAGWGLSRTVAALLIVGLTVAGLILIMLLLIPVLFDQLFALISNLPDYVTRSQALVADVPWLRRFVGTEPPGRAIHDLVTQSSGWMTAFLVSLWSGGKALISLASLIVVMPVVTFYLLIDWHRIVVTVDSWIPRQHRDAVHAVMGDIDRVVTGFVRGQVGVCLILGAYYAVALSLVGLNFGWAIGLTSGLITFIPYLGSMFGLVLAVAVAVAQFWPDWTWIAAVLGIYAVGQFLEGNVLVPNLVGRNVGLHPVLLMLAMFAFGYLFGFVGLLVAVPLAATIGVLSRFALTRYLASPFYTGERGGLTAMSLHSPRQLALALSHTESFAREDFLGGPSNAPALALVESFPDWPSNGIVLMGPEGSGKSHLAAIWANAAGARFLGARALAQTDPPAALATGALVIEDIAPGEFDERALFHLLNFAREQAAYRLLTARTAPAGWSVAICDLGSRLKALPVVALAAPDDALLRAVLVKLFADRQLLVDESLVGYVAARIERSFAAARAVVARLDGEAMRLQRPLTRALAAEILRSREP